MDIKNHALNEQLHRQQGSRVAQARILTDVIRDSGEKLAGQLNGDTLNFAKILASENEKHRRLQELRQHGREGLKQPQPLL